MVRVAVVKAKEDWVNKVAAEGEAARRDGHIRRGSIRRLQRADSSRRPVRTTAVLKTDGELTKGPEKIVDRWYGGAILRDKLLELMRNVWNEGEVFDAWRDTLIVPVPKKGNLQSCNSWRGISLLDVVGKVFARIVQGHLQVIAERLLPDS